MSNTSVQSAAKARAHAEAGAARLALNPPPKDCQRPVDPKGGVSRQSVLPSRAENVRLNVHHRDAPSVAATTRRAKHLFGHSEISARVQPSPAKINLFPKTGTQAHNFAVPRPLPGRIAIVTTRGAGCGGRARCGRRMHCSAYGQAVWSCPLDAGVKLIEMIGQRRWLSSPIHRGEHGAAVKPLRRECRSDFGVPVLACARLFLFCA